LRYGAAYRAQKKLLGRSEWWSREELEAYQRAQLRALIEHAASRIPYYRELFAEHGIRPEHIRTARDLRIVPPLTKETIRRDLDKLVDPTLPPSRLRRIETGGTTGLPMPIVQHATEVEAREWAFVWRNWRWAGFRPAHRRAILRGNRFPPSRGGERRCWEHNPVQKAVVFSSFCMRDEELHTYARVLSRFRPAAIQAYPSSLHLMTRFFRNHGIPPVPLRCLLTSSETLHPHQREEIEAYWGAPVFDLYGNAERSVMVAQCERGGYHVISEYGILSLEDESGDPVVDFDRPGEIVSTGFLNRAMPFIRYRTGDIAVYREGACACGRAHPLLHGIMGRIQEFFVDRNGGVVRSMFSDEPIMEFTDRLTAYQYVQTVPGRLRLDLEAKPGCGFTDAERASIVECFHSYFPDFDLEIALADSIPRTRSGKFRYVIQHLAIEDL
jgi:phenylacetate-CoA ligase